MANSGKKNAVTTRNTMILYICNHVFPHNSGFATRCKNEIDMLKKQEDVVLLCRENDTGKEPLFYRSPNGNIPIIRFSSRFKSVERFDDKTYFSGIYEIIRNLDIFVSFGMVLLKTLIKYSKKEQVKIYCVNAPLTIPLFTGIIARFFSARLNVLDFHDLEPEMAMHIKNLDKKSLVLKVEFMLEKLMCQWYSKIVVSSRTQRQILLKRTNLSPEKFFVLPNSGSIQAKNTTKQTGLYNQFHLSKDNFILLYSGNLTYDYTISGVLSLLERFEELIGLVPTITFVIAGDGDGLALLKEKVAKKHLQSYVLFPGRVQNVLELLSISHVTLIPWERNELSETILPTKLLEFMAAEKPIIAPDFGEFSKVLKHNKTALLYGSKTEIIQAIHTLYTDTEFRKELAEQAGVQYQQHFSISVLEPEYLRFVIS